ncbi:hypothetical protein VIH_000528 [Vibrio cholerae CT 5369-93]|nr:hypothetical protein VIH_000528 [Vibrio cholerae CT 5369-93]
MRSSSCSLVATSNLPQFSTGILCCAQNAKVRSTPRLQKSAFKLPGA